MNIERRIYLNDQEMLKYYNFYSELYKCMNKYIKMHMNGADGNITSHLTLDKERIQSQFPEAHSVEMLFENFRKEFENCGKTISSAQWKEYTDQFKYGWELFRKFGKSIRDTDTYWEELISKSHSIYIKCHKSKFVCGLLISIMTEIQEVATIQKKLNTPNTLVPNGKKNNNLKR